MRNEPITDEDKAILDEPRICVESGVAGRIASIAGPVARELGYRLVRVRMSGQNGAALQIMAERADGTFTIDDCELFSKAVSPAIDVEDPIKNAYALEVSSPGMDRPLVRISDFARWVGFDVKIELNQMIEGRKRARGIIANADALELSLKLDDREDELRFPYAAIDEAKLVMNDHLILEAQKRAKNSRIGAGQVGDGALLDPQDHEDISIQEDRRTSHGRQR